MQKHFGSLVFLVFIAILFVSPPMVVVKPANADGNVTHEWHGTHRFYDSNGNYCYSDNRFTTTTESYNHPSDTPREVPVGGWVTDENGNPAFHQTGTRTVYEHTSHNMTINIHRGSYNHYLSGSCN